ncbi:peptidylprolyl isomerase [Piscinibacter terrae]|uniref:peptidylprolyl isomerase n=1 Tax=Piscinibacter terrae TaxID=2496871 RepID=A0A3N7HRW6_9BURK|nr:peptidylprolyl isomerase [Albitalea terrae]RQP23946.1 peptidylprolyl isomerase [Albitalea terrae]
MKKMSAAACVALALIVPAAAMAQNVAIVNGKPVQKSRVDTLINQAVKQGQPKTPELEKQARDEVVLREMFMQEAERRGLTKSPEVQTQLDLARQTVIIRALFDNEREKSKVSDADVQAEYDKLKAQNSGTEYRASHILVEKEDDAKALIKQLNGGAKFDEVAKKNSKDPGSAEKGGDLDFAKPDSYVPEFSAALTKLKKGEMTQDPVKSQFGYHIIKLEDTRESQFPPLADVKPQIEQRLLQAKLAKFRDEIKAKAKTDYKFSN